VRAAKFMCAHRIRMQPDARPRKKLLRPYRGAWSIGGMENDKGSFLLLNGARFDCPDGVRPWGWTDWAVELTPLLGFRRMEAMTKQGGVCRERRLGGDAWQQDARFRRAPGMRRSAQQPEIGSGGKAEHEDRRSARGSRRSPAIYESSVSRLRPSGLYSSRLEACT